MQNSFAKIAKCPIRRIQSTFKISSPPALHLPQVASHRVQCHYKFKFHFPSSHKYPECREVFLGHSAVNFAEVDITLKILCGFLEQGVLLGDIGVVLPYRAQAIQILKRMCDPAELFFKLVLKLFGIGQTTSHYGRHDPRTNNPHQSDIDTVNELIQSHIRVDTVDSFQGSERSLMIFNCVRTTPASFLTKERTNVALTRAQYGMIIIGDHTSFPKDSIFGKLVQLYTHLGSFVPPHKVKGLLSISLPEVVRQTIAKQTQEDQDRAREQRQADFEAAEMSNFNRPSILNKNAGAFVPKSVIEQQQYRELSPYMMGPILAPPGS